MKAADKRDLAMVTRLANMTDVMEDAFGCYDPETFRSMCARAEELAHEVEVMAYRRMREARGDD